MTRRRMKLKRKRNVAGNGSGSPAAKTTEITERLRNISDLKKNFRYFYC
jgi:hypothetical protein